MALRKITWCLAPLANPPFDCRRGLAGWGMIYKPFQIKCTNVTIDRFNGIIPWPTVEEFEGPPYGQPLPKCIGLYLELDDERGLAPATQIESRFVKRLCTSPFHQHRETTQSDRSRPLASRSAATHGSIAMKEPIPRLAPFLFQTPKSQSHPHHIPIKHPRLNCSELTIKS